MVANEVIRRLLPDEAEAYRTLRLAALAEAPEAFGSDVATESAAPVDKFAATLRDGYVAGGFVDGRLVAVTHVFERARTEVQQVHLAATATNAAAVALYESLGFERYGTEPRALYVNGRYLDEYLMVLRFL